MACAGKALLLNKKKEGGGRCPLVPALLDMPKLDMRMPKLGMPKLDMRMP
jgi:hypothetical protein